jgi:hypothetical protein
MYDKSVVIMEIKDGTTKELVGTITVIPDNDVTFWYQYNMQMSMEICAGYWGLTSWEGRCVPHYELKHRLVSGCPAGML